MARLAAVGSGIWRLCLALLVCVCAVPAVSGQPVEQTLLAGHVNAPTSGLLDNPTLGAAFLTTELVIDGQAGIVLLDFANSPEGGVKVMGHPDTKPFRFLVDPRTSESRGLPPGNYQLCWSALRQDERNYQPTFHGCWPTDAGASKRTPMRFTVNAGEYLYLGHLRFEQVGATRDIVIAQTLYKPGQKVGDERFRAEIDIKLKSNGITDQNGVRYMVMPLPDRSYIMTAVLRADSLPDGVDPDRFLIKESESLTGVTEYDLKKIKISVVDQFDALQSQLPENIQEKVQKSLISLDDSSYIYVK